MDSNYFGAYLAELRRKKKLKQKQIALSAELDSSYLAALENGRRLPPRVEVMEKLFLALEANAAEQQELRRTAILSQLGRVILQHADDYVGATTALTLLEISTVLSQDELKAIRTLMEGYRHRTYTQGRNNM